MSSQGFHPRVAPPFMVKKVPLPAVALFLKNNLIALGGPRRSSNKILCDPRIVRDADAVKGERQAGTCGDCEAARTRSESDPVYDCIL